MLTAAVLLMTVACLSQPGRTGTLKRKRESGVMASDYISEEETGSALYGDYSNELVLYFYVTYDKPFKEALRQPDSIAFLREAGRVERNMAALIARDIGLIIDDVTVEVITFLPGTKAEIAVKVPEYYGITEEELSDSVNKIVDDGTISGAEIIKIEELKDDFPGGVIKNEAIILEMIYRNDISDGSLDLSNEKTQDFKNEAHNVREQLTLHLVDKLADQGIIVNPDQVNITILSFEGDGENTKVQMSVEGGDIGIEQISYALQYFVIDDDVHINGSPIESLEELSRDVAYIYEEGPTDEKVMELGDYGPDVWDDVYDEPTPPDDLFPIIEGEVMPDKDRDVLNGDINGIPEYDREPVPPDEDYNLIIPGLENVPPEETGSDEEAVPPEEPDHCPSLDAPERGSIDCLNENEIGSICQFTCHEDTRLEGEETIICDRDGFWSADPPYCIRIFCQPHQLILDNGMIGCTNHNVFESVCTFSCDPGFNLIGAKFLVCQMNETWSDKGPICEADPINCEEEYGEWSACADGKRMKDSVMVSRAGASTVCPEVIEECIDCELDWAPWTGCVDGVRHRTERVLTERVGAGKDCLEPNVEEQECRDCRIEWGDWSECSDKVRTRSQYVAVIPIGGSECPPRDIEVEDCIDCLVRWGDWSECENGVSRRSQVVEQDAVGGGASCPELLEETDDCRDCVLEWGPWTECSDNFRTREQYVATSPDERGRACPDSTEFQSEECRDCEVEMTEWTECENGIRGRELVITSPQLGAGQPCPPYLLETEPCAHCGLEWGDWEECIEGKSRRVQVIVEHPIGAGDACEDLKFEVKDCANCEVDWGEWGECANGVRSRTQYVSQQPFEVDEPCPTLATDEEPCVDCVSSWGPWSECLRGLERRVLLIETESVGTGVECPLIREELRECCYLQWGLWSACEDGERYREEQVLVQPEGKTCPEPQLEVESCADCILDWGEWSDCENNKVMRMQKVVQEAIGTGEDCPELDIQTEYCSNCVVEWETWSACEDGMRERAQYIAEVPVGAGEACPELEFETHDCKNCDVDWEEWGECADGRRARSQYIVQNAAGGGEPCPVLQTEFEDCVDCVIEWDEWSACENEERHRSQFIDVYTVGVGKECPPLDTETEPCINCEMAWEEWSECSNDQRTRKQYILVEPEGAGTKCPDLQTLVEPCIDCVVEWSPWNECFNDVRRREQRIVVALVGAGSECPPLDVQIEPCVGTKKALEKTICRFTDVVLGYKRDPSMRDLLLVGDESGSIGWVNFEKIKDNFKSIAKNIRGGIGSQETQLAMTSFARFSRTLFDFDDYNELSGIIAAIDKAYFGGGYRSRIGGALSEANAWLFQQTGGMRSFPQHEDDNIVHEILIATDGCRTSDAYHLEEGLKVIKKRGIKLYVLAVASKDQRCQEAVRSMVENEDDLFELGSWEELDELNKRIEERVCITTSQDETDDEEEDDYSGDYGSRGDSTSWGHFVEEDPSLSDEK